MATKEMVVSASGTGMAEASAMAVRLDRNIKLSEVRTRSELSRAVSKTSEDNLCKEELFDYSDYEDEVEVIDKMDIEGNVFNETDEEKQEDKDKQPEVTGEKVKNQSSHSEISTGSQASQGCNSSVSSDAGLEESVGKNTRLEIKLGTGYNTVKVARRVASSQRQLNQFPVQLEITSTGSFEGADGRVLQCVLVHDLRGRLNKSLSFNPDGLHCAVCARGKHPALKSDAGGPVILVASDYKFPACIPSTDNGECMRIVRVEDGSLQEVMYALANAVGNNKLVGGTVIMLGSLSYLGEVGTGQYLAD